VPEGVSMQQAMEVAAEHLRTVGEVAQGAGIELWLETHDTFSKGKHAGQVVELASHPAVQINYDVMHPLRNGESLDQTFEALNGYIRHAHWHDCLLDPKQVAITRFGEGEMPLVDILRRLDAVGFEGFLSGEWFGDQLGAPPREALTHYIEATKALLQEI
jgi:sugar phosphate isomerase/epimerase